MTGEQKSIHRAAPLLFALAGVLFGLAAWLGQQIALAGVSVMFLMLGLVFWLKSRRADRA